MLISDAPCEIMRTFMLGIAPNTLAAMPRVPRMFSPTRQTMALRPSYFTSASFCRSAAMAGIDSLESTVRETLTSDVETMSTGHLWRLEAPEKGFLETRALRQPGGAAS